MEEKVEIKKDDNEKKSTSKVSSTVTEPKALYGDKLNFAVTEAYNLLRTNISFLLSDKKGKCKIIGITSSCPQEGKSYTSINTAYTLAKDGNKVLLIDGDMRKPTIGKALGSKEKVGLSNLIAGIDECEPKQVGLHKNVSVIFSGSIPPNPSELIGSDEMGALLQKYSEKYDYIIIDLPPITAVSDPIVVSKFLDGVILVIKHGYTKKKDLAEAMRLLDFAKAKILGVVYNAYKAEHGAYYYRRKKYYYYKDRYYQSSDGSSSKK